MKARLDEIDFKDKTVLDIGCWDGYWSFYAERRGAKSVLATDDISQNWAEGTGIHLAKELYGSSIDINQGMPVYEVASLDQKFDIILCLGVHYHLYDPYYAFCQIRHCCHENTIVMLQGAASHKLQPGTAKFCFDDPSTQTFLPSISVLEMFLEAAYLSVEDVAFFQKAGLWRDIKEFGKRVLGKPYGIDSANIVCRPLVGENPQQPYAPHFGLAQYDPRYQELAKG
jgi:tRNA (mo5U34)-methyltransferase